MSATITALHDHLVSLGFTSGDVHRDISDRPVQGLLYLTRQFGQPPQHQYLSIMVEPWNQSSPRFLEAVLFVYVKPFNPRDKQKQIPLCGVILRDMERVVETVNLTYPLASIG